MRGILLRAVAALALLPAAGAVAAAGWTMTRHVIAGGGGHSQGGGYSLQGTIGQPAIGVSDATRERVWSGFWGPQASVPAGDDIFRDGFEG